ncbi:unnamed protein product (macronuclear) [Paramecium tetraurelia]|uniref:cathepsin L n=1 Tax=Paramecium tetraurelia TaxID=5888 RepID=A0CS14_PARTE|nr:uncharacterized protein GSPATT00009853001 [Paramecium tetraurelia]CAK73581.1 unnamed protein product [Paramecium tetraurelia]|eukprot:XP_001440978.1 hypothetical protein (macronuclear) [Paramecium tetraurelia strain d4-2]
MQKTFLVSGLTLLLTSIGSIQNHQPDDVSLAFQEFKKKYQKSYTIPEEIFRRVIFRSNYEKIQAHNSDKTQTYSVDVNQFTDFSQDEFVAIQLSFIPPSGWKPSDEEVIQVGVEPNDSVDWRSKVRVKNQQWCGAGWAFSAVGAVEAFFKIKKNLDYSLSEQYLIDCDRTKNKGCLGGHPDLGIKYIANYGIYSESAYIYAGDRNQVCTQLYGIHKIKNSGVQSIEKTGLKAAIKEYPITVSVDATNWNHYKEGVFNNCNKNINHVVLAVGYDSKGNWIIKNSWGTTWGEQGFMTLKAGDTCGVTQMAFKAI